MKFKKFITILIAVILVLVLCGCTAQDNPKSNKPLIAVSILPQKTFVEKVCGDKFEVSALIPSGASPETYEPTPQEITALENANIYFSIGVPVEESILENIPDKTKICKLHTAVSKVYPDLTDEDHGGRDPHIWLSPKRVIVMVNNIADTLSAFDPENASFYKENAEKYIKELKDLDNEINYIFKDKRVKRFIVFHPSFGYFADDYGILMYALEEHGKEATAQRIAEMADFAKIYNIKTIFYQAENSGRQAQAFAEEIGGNAVALSPLAEDYISNLKTIAEKIYEATN